MFTTPYDREPIDILIKWEPQGVGGYTHALRRDPTARPMRDELLWLRTRGLTPVSDEDAGSYVLKVLRESSSSWRPEHAYEGREEWGPSVISDTLRRLLEQFPHPGIEFIPVRTVVVDAEEELRSDEVAGEPFVERYWILHCFNMVDAIDRTASRAEWWRPSEHPIISVVDEFASTDEEVFKPEKLVLRTLPDDALFGLTGLPKLRFASEWLFDAVIEAKLFRDRWVPFRRYHLVAAEENTGGWYDSQSAEERVPLRLNGRTIYHGNLKKPLRFNPRIN